MERNNARERIELTADEYLSLMTNGKCSDGETVIVVPDEEMLPALSAIEDLK